MYPDRKTTLIVDKASAMNTLHKIYHGGTSSSEISIGFVNYAYQASCVCDDITKTRFILNVHCATLMISKICLGNTACIRSTLMQIPIN